MCRKLTLLVYWAVATALLSAIPTFGQTTNGLITGVITDPSEAVVTGAHVELLNTTTGVRRETATDAVDGRRGRWSRFRPALEQVTLIADAIAARSTELWPAGFLRGDEFCARGGRWQGRD